ncbi:hypothetical protein K4K49_003524 [Colletotrichum sp. SAR 10_70]|nr:hypothetical protein K4K50_005100 [Colletotrichum sp. SAR 10_71]KAI8172464.1 hypothetical protein K4K49_003524 [Colletotrichum sp. SAR 10_70]KAI8228521.1 hypothetical protein K4K53_005746 [Colletotrichum sp. SAR 10_77]
MRPSISALRGPLARRCFGTTTRLAASENGTGAAVNPRWLSELQARIKRVAGLQLDSAQKEELKGLREAVDGQWLELLAGREGFLTGPGWRGLDKHTVTWGDQDAMGTLELRRHVNNVVYNKYAESARVNWLRNFATTVDPKNADEWNQLMSPKDIGLIMRSIKTDYKFPMAYPDNVTVLHKLAAKPTYESDFVLLEALLVSDRHRRPAARCFEDIVVYDYKTAKRTALKPFMVDRLRETYEAQERSKQECEEKIEGLVKVVERLEKSANSSSKEEDTNVKMGSISFREHIRWVPDEAGEPTSTIVLTSPQRRFVDLRILKAPTAEGQETHGIERLEWGIAGTSSSSLIPDGKGGEVRHSRWDHWIDSRTTEPETAGDEGDMYPQEGDLTLEKGRMVNPATGQECDYEELWRDVDPEPASVKADDAAKPECVVLKYEDETSKARGMIVWLGRFCQGISRVGEDVSAERWEWKEEEGWKRTIRIGTEGTMPCEVLLKTGAQLSVGAHVKHGEMVWDVLESSG